jgi:GAF domain-containing protein
MIAGANTARMFAALSATNEAILYAKSPDQLYQQVCEAAFSSGDFLAAAILLLDPETSTLRFAAGAGKHVEQLRDIVISVVETTPCGLGLSGEAFRDQTPRISNDFLNDERSFAWRDKVRALRIGSAAALPLTRAGRSIGVLVVYLHEAGALDEQMVSLLERMTANVSFALDNFDRDAARKTGERTMRRPNRMYGAISATNEAILRAKTAQELYQQVCDAAVYSGKSLATVIFLEEPGSTWLKPVAGTGDTVDLARMAPFSTDPDNVYGKGVCGNAFRTQKPCVNRDILNSAQGQPWLQSGRETGVVACVAVPLIKTGKSVGILMFFVSKSWADDDEIIVAGAHGGECLVCAREFRSRG